MIDTVKLSLSYESRPIWLQDVRMDDKYNHNSGYYTAKIQPRYENKFYKQEGLYLPKLNYVERPMTGEQKRSYTLYIELSLPKLYYGNNFNELTDDIFSAVVTKLSGQLHSIFNLNITTSEIEQARLGRVDYSKNIIFTDRTPISTIIGVIKLADIPKTYDIQENMFRNGGHILHIHTNTQDVAMYDKISDLKQARISDKRSREKDNYVQLNLIDELDKHRNITVTRFEIRLGGMRKIRKELKAVGLSDDLRFSKLFSTDTSRKILLLHLQKIMANIPRTEIDTNTAGQLLMSYKQSDPRIKFAEASALTLMQLLRNEAQDERAVRNLIEGLFSTAQYYRLKKKSRKPPTQSQLKDLRYIEKAIKAMKPVTLIDYVK